MYRKVQFQVLYARKYDSNVSSSYFLPLMHSELINILLYRAWSFLKYFRNTSATTEYRMKSKEMNRW